MTRRNIRINRNFTSQPTCHKKTIIHDTMYDNLSKYIVYTNTASSLDMLKVNIESWLNSNDKIRGDTMIIQGDMKP